jgi:hypothetical protein
MDKATHRPTTDPEAIERYKKKLRKVVADQARPVRAAPSTGFGVSGCGGPGVRPRGAAASPARAGLLGVDCGATPHRARHAALLVPPC